MVDLNLLKEFVNSLNQNSKTREDFKQNPEDVVQNFLGNDINSAEISKIISFLQGNLGNINLQNMISNLNLNSFDTDGDGKFDLKDVANLAGKFFKK